MWCCGCGDVDGDETNNDEDNDDDNGRWQATSDKRQLWQMRTTNPEMMINRNNFNWYKNNNNNNDKIKITVSISFMCKAYFDENCGILLHT